MMLYDRKYYILHALVTQYNNVLYLKKNQANMKTNKTYMRDVEIIKHLWLCSYLFVDANICGFASYQNNNTYIVNYTMFFSPKQR